ncbi:Putative conserved hypothetical protein [Candidatus Fokinia solitaria]|uniref:UPF0102 protein Fsol_00074 n=1 Tax=Candidatus Fokinia solitaria TaxID=1802984 RepID=A0A2U8BRC5_9RICK|nr:YraN family protein [Candidatus Fokinia solitaria]AWD32887.1 Putative conserved hypothetical protein [Candidatus Fokinia solitaria]
MKFQRIFSNKYGKFGEELVSEMLSKKNHMRIASRYKTPYGEIDIITAYGENLVFSEVKARNFHKSAFNVCDRAITNHISFDEFEKIFSERQMQRIINAASFFNAENQQFSNYNQRFDLYIIRGKEIIEYFENISMR